MELLLDAGADVMSLNHKDHKALDSARSEAVKKLLVVAEKRITCHGFKQARIDHDDEIVEEDDDQS